MHYGHMAYASHMVASSIVHAIIWGSVYKLMRALTLSEALCLAALVVACFVFWPRSGGRRSF